jgi:hypothetical protein
VRASPLLNAWRIQSDGCAARQHRGGHEEAEGAVEAGGSAKKAVEAGGSLRRRERKVEAPDEGCGAPPQPGTKLERARFAGG